MTGHAIAVDAVALLVAAIGFHLAFRQRLVRRLWAAARGRSSAAEAPSTFGDQDPARYAMFIAGTMIMAFGVIVFIATTLQAS